MVVTTAAQLIREAEHLKEIILKFKNETSLLHERSLWSTQEELQKVYQKVLVMDLNYALEKKVEQDLWNIGFKQQIEALQNITKDRKHPRRSDGQALLLWVLQSAGGFYLCLLHQLCTAFKLDLPFRRRASLVGWVEGWSPGAAAATACLPPPAAARYICQHCLVHLGDLARYRQQPRVAYTFYRHALIVSTHSGQPYNQLGLLARRRGRRLGALYWHVRAVLVRTPFPPAPNNLLRTLQQYASQSLPPVLPGMRRAAPAPAPPASRLDGHGHITELMRAMYMIHSHDNLEFAGTLVDVLNNSLPSLVASRAYESMTLIKMVCVIIWLVHSATEQLKVGEGALSAAEATAAAHGLSLAAGALLALLLPAVAASTPPDCALPALKVFLQWLVQYPQLLATEAFQARPQLWHALAHTLNNLKGDSSEKYDTVPLPEDDELHGFEPLEESFQHLRFVNHATWEVYGRRVPETDSEKKLVDEVVPTSVISPPCLSEDREAELGVRAHRIIELGKRLAALSPEQFCYTTENDEITFTALCPVGDELALAVAELQSTAVTQVTDDELDSEDESPLPPPVIISEADFREKVREKRVGILKPQGSLERAREERALASTDDQAYDGSDDLSKGDDRREARRPRVNIAMAAILRKQEESCKQVKFRTPPPVMEDQEADTTLKADSTIDRPKIKQQKSLADIPVGRKTGGILALKDKSGYPHLVNIANETSTRKVESNEVQRDPKVIQPPGHSAKREAPQPKWQQPYEVRPSHRNYGLHGNVKYRPNYQAPATVTSQNIRLPVVNPKEIDVRSAAFNKQSGSDYPQRPNYPIGSDKKSFMDDLPPRFANQRWNQETVENKFREENSSVFNTRPPPNWHSPMQRPLPTQTPMQPSLPNQVRPPIPPQLSMPPPSLSDTYPPMSWWKNNTFNPPPTHSEHLIAMQTLLNAQLSGNLMFNMPPPGQMPLSNAGTMSPPGYRQQSPIGPQLPARHASPPSYNPFPALPYPSVYDSYPSYQSRDYQDESRYRPPMQPSLDAVLDLTIRKPAPSQADYMAPYSNRRFEEGALERAMDEALDASPIDHSKADETEDTEAPADNPGTYSLFSRAPGACDWGPMAQGQQALWGGGGPLRLRQQEKRRHRE